MKAGWIGRAAAAAWVLALAGCASDVTSEIRTNAPARERVMNAIAGNGVWAQEMTQRLLATDSLRVRMVETMLRDNSSAQYLLVRIARNPDAVDLVLQAASADSVGREHVMTLLKGMEMALKAAGRH